MAIYNHSAPKSWIEIRADRTIFIVWIVGLSVVGLLITVGWMFVTNINPVTTPKVQVIFTLSDDHPAYNFVNHVANSQVKFYMGGTLSWDSEVDRITINGTEVTIYYHYRQIGTMGMRANGFLQGDVIVNGNMITYEGIWDDAAGRHDMHSNYDIQDFQQISGSWTGTTYFGQNRLTLGFTR